MIIKPRTPQAVPRNLVIVASLSVMLVVLLVTVSMSGVLAADEPSELRDVRQETRIATTIELNPYLRDSKIEVSVQDGEAVLSGVVSEQVNRDLAEQIALGTEGITDVRNNIEVDNEYTPGPDSNERSFGEVIEDASVTAAVKSKLLWSRYTDGLATDVETHRGHVTLSGTANSEAAKDLAGMLAQNTVGVTSVENKLVVRTNPEVEVAEEASSERSTLIRGNDLSGATDEAGRTISDTWITTKVKSTLLYSRNVGGTSINVSTQDGVVSLSGSVRSQAELDAAVELARNVQGVQDVIASDLTF